VAKRRTIHICNACGSQQPRWLGRCPDCGEWDTLQEELVDRTPSGGASGVPPLPSIDATPAIPICEVEPKAEARVATGLAELDRVLGGGLVPGSGMLLAGEPGIGKSTLLLQTARRVAAGGARFLYVTGEESAAQVRLRSDRIDPEGRDDELFLLAECDLERIEAQIAAVRPAVVGIDSVQTVRWADIPSSAGGVVQVREVTSRLLALARREGFPILLVGHVTKDGGVAGPRVLEHMVDGVLQFEGERGQPLRILRGIKNRFGSTQEVGIFEMRSTGLAEISNPSKLLLGERRHDAPGPATAAILEGSRPLLVEVQALVSPASHGAAARKVSGLDASRLSMLAAVFEKRLGLPFAERDIHANVVGGVRMTSTAGDLALAAALLSSLHDNALPADCVFIGEVGLLGEVRPVAGMGERLEEARRLGFRSAAVPVGSIDPDAVPGVKVHEIRDVGQLGRKIRPE